MSLTELLLQAKAKKAEEFLLWWAASRGREWRRA